MQLKRVFFTSFLLLVFGLIAIHAQNCLKVKDVKGTQAFYTLNDIQKLTFSSGNLMVSKTNGSEQLFALNDISFLKFNNLFEPAVSLELNKTKSLQLYPNPVVDVLTVSYSSRFKENLKIDIVNMEGKVVLTKSIFQTEFNNEIKLNLTSLPKGIYLFRSIKGSTIETARLVKN